MSLAITYLTFEQVRKINRDLFPSSKTGINYEGGLKFILSYVHELYDELGEKDAIIAKCAYLWYNIASSQYFTNGSKRTGYLVADDFLRLNNLKMKASEDEKYTASEGIANHILTVDHVSQWVTKALKPY